MNEGGRERRRKGRVKKEKGKKEKEEEITFNIKGGKKRSAVENCLLWHLLGVSGRTLTCSSVRICMWWVQMDLNSSLETVLFFRVSKFSNS